MLLSVLLLFGLALVLNVNFSSAASVNQSNVKHITTTNSGVHVITATKSKAASTSTKLVSGLTLAQIKDGFNRAQKFYNTKYRMPNYVSYGTKKISISQFQKIIATQGLKIKVVSVGRPVYITSDNINNKCTDTARINSIVNGLRTLGINAYNMGLGPNTHIKALQSSQVPKNALVVDIYGGADAGLIYEMGSSWYKSIKGAKKVFTVYWPPSKVITGLSYLVRAHDDNYDRASFKGLAHPDQYMLKLGYNYLYSGCITSIVNAIQHQATH